jgi:hypothetical protein
MGKTHAPIDDIRDLLVFGCLSGDRPLGACNPQNDESCDGLCAVRIAIHFILCFPQTSQKVKEKSKWFGVTLSGNLKTTLQDIFCFMRGGCGSDSNTKWTFEQENEYISEFMENYDNYLKVYNSNYNKGWRSNTEFRINKSFIIGTRHSSSLNYTKLNKVLNCSEIMSVLQSLLQCTFSFIHEVSQKSIFGRHSYHNNMLYLETANPPELKDLFEGDKILFKKTGFVVLQKKNVAETVKAQPLDTFEVYMPNSGLGIGSDKLRRTMILEAAVLLDLNNKNCNNSRNHFFMIRRSPQKNDVWLELKNGKEKLITYDDMRSMITTRWVRLLYLLKTNP